MRADKVFSAQARANKPIFYHSNGKARSMQEVYEVIVSKHDAVTMIAQASTNKDLRTSGELTQVATLPNAKPADGAATINQKSFDHLAGDPAAAFAMRTKPAGPGQIARADNTGPQLPQGELFQLAKTDVPLPERTAGQGATTTASAAFLEESVGSVTPDRPVPQTTREAAIDGDDFDASNRVLSAFQATETANPFEALFRNDAASNQAGVNPRFASAFAAVEEAALVSALSGASNQVQAQELALVNQGGPLDLTRFLRLKAEEEQKDLLPPA
jgi:hypothetical protein